MPVVALTDRTVKALKPAARQVDYWDSHLKGFGVRISSEGRRTWTVRYRLRGRQRRLSLGVYPHLGLAAARGAARSALGKVADGQDPAATKATERQLGTFRDLAERYVDKHAKRKKRSWKADARILRVELVPILGARRVSEITRGHMRHLIDDIAEDRPIMANRTLALAKTVFNFALDEDVEGLQGNPCARLTPPGDERPRDRVLSREEIVKLWAALEVDRDPHVTAVFRVQLLTGQRVREVLTMGWSDLDVGGQVWTIPSTRTKNKRVHVVPLSPQVLSIIQRLAAVKSSETWVFPSPAAKEKPRVSIYPVVERLRAASGVDFVTHDLRRTCATGMGELGVDEAIISRVLNHVTDLEKGVTWRYNRFQYADAKRAALEKWGAKIEAVTQGE